MKWVITCLLLFTLNLKAEVSTSPFVPCLSTREYITTLEFLRDVKAFSLDEKNSRDISQKVTQGCTGSSKRFIQVVNVLSKAGIPSQKALEVAIKFSSSQDETVASFLTIFKGAFVENLLDLDVSSALNVALELTLNYEGNLKLAEKQFHKLVEFCLDKKSLDLPLLECARMSVRVVKSASEFEFDVAKDFIQLFNYLVDSKKANLATYVALKTAEFTIQYGPESSANFKNAYEYALKKSGLESSQKDALEFAKSMASLSIKKLKNER